MVSKGPGRQGSRWRKLADRLKKELPPVCWLCGEGIDLTLDAQKDANGWTLDHVIPLSEGGAAEDPANLRPAHRHCNSRRAGGRAKPANAKASRNWG